MAAVLKKPLTAETAGTCDQPVPQNQISINRITEFMTEDTFGANQTRIDI